MGQARQEVRLMRIGGQIALSLGLVVAGVAGWVLLLPEAQPTLAALGLSRPAAETGASGSGPAPQALAVRVEPFGRQAQSDLVTAIGTARGIRSVELSTEVTGRITAIHVAPGDQVARGDLLIELDSEAARLALEQSRLRVADAREKSERLARLAPSGAVTDQQIKDADFTLRSAELDEQKARLDLEQHRILAPIDGRIGLLPVETGDMVATGTPITSVEDRSSLIVEFRLPERLVPVVKPGDTLTARALNGTDAPVEGRISALDNRIAPESRSLAAEAIITNPADRLRPGMALSVTLQITGAEHLAVDPMAIQWGAEGAFVWVARDGKASRLPVRILQRGAERVLIDAEPEAQDQVIVEGTATLRPGASVAPGAPGGN